MPMKMYRKTRRAPLTRKSGGLNKKRVMRRAKTASLANLIKKVSLSKCETKDCHRILENEQLYHNTPAIQTGFLTTYQSIGDADTGTSNFDARLGNEIILRGLSIKFWFANKLDRPNVMYKIIVYRYKIDGSYTNPPYCAQGTTNFMLRDLDTDQFKILKSKVINLQIGGNASLDSAGAWKPREAHRALKFYIPFKNQKYRYKSNNSGYGSYWDIGVSVVCYDSYGTLTTDNIASYAISHKLYFKDP